MSVPRSVPRAPAYSRRIGPLGRLRGEGPGDHGRRGEGQTGRDAPPAAGCRPALTTRGALLLLAEGDLDPVALQLADGRLQLPPAALERLVRLPLQAADVHENVREPAGRAGVVAE